MNFRKRAIATRPRGHDTDRQRDGLNQHAECNDQQRKACAGLMDVGLEPGFICHAVSVEQKGTKKRPFNRQKPCLRLCFKEWSQADSNR